MPTLKAPLNLYKVADDKYFIKIESKQLFAEDYMNFFNTQSQTISVKDINDMNNGLEGHTSIHTACFTPTYSQFLTTLITAL